MVLQAEAVSLLKKQDVASIPLIIADPPYGIGYHSNHYKGKNPHAPVMNDWNFQIGAFLSACERALVDGGALYLFSRWDVYPLWLPYVQAAGLKVKTKIVWVKNNWSAGDLTGCFGNQYEEILFIVKGRHKLRGRRWPNVWHFDRISSGRMLHPTQKPTLLLKRAIESSSNPGDLVLDPFAGSGSTGEAAVKSGRQYLLGDIDPKMVNIARKRLRLPLLEISGEDAIEPDCDFTMPTPDDWGMHPEQIKFIYNELRGNIEHAPDRAQLNLLI